MKLNTKDTKKRIPRPLGITYLSLQLNKEKEPLNQAKLKRQIQRRLIEQYVSNGLTLNNKPIPINQFATFIDMDLTELIKEMNREMETLGNMFKGEDGLAIARVGILKALFEAQEISATAKAQTALLLASQGQEYVPFLSSAVNQSIANLANAQKPMLDVLRMMLGGGPGNTTNILIGNPNGQQQNDQWVTPDTALRMLSETGQKSLLPPNNDINQHIPELEEVKDELEAKEGPLPEVGAKFQDLNKIGIRYDGTKNKDA